jgi:hypothetical protein
MQFVHYLVVLIPLLCLAAVFGLRFWWKSRKKRIADTKLEQARRGFFRRREWLEADFWKLGAASGLPRGLRWVNCEFDDDVSFAWDRKTGDLTALMGVTIEFAAIEGGCMEGVEAVSNLKAATAVFQFRGQRWSATGKTVFNLNPRETIRYYQNELELVDY